MAGGRKNMKQEAFDLFVGQRELVELRNGELPDRFAYRAWREVRSWENPDQAFTHRANGTEIVPVGLPPEFLREMEPWIEYPSRQT